jgi:FkbH-like protein
LKCLEYPFDGEYILRKKKSIKKKLLNSNISFIKKKIAILGGSTTSDIRLMMELFLLNQGIQPEFYESEFNQYYQDAMFPNEDLEAFTPDIILIHTSNRNIISYPLITDTKEQINYLLTLEIQNYVGMWERLAVIYHCPIIQNNFEYPFYRLMGNKEASDIHGKINYINRINEAFYEYAQTHENFYINDINYLSSCYGLDKWSDPFYWHMYKYCCCVPAIPGLAFNVVNIIKSIFGMNKKGFVLDLDNTLWGGIIGDDGPDNIILGQENSMGQVYCEFQNYLKEQKQLGVILNIDSKNNYENAISGLSHADASLKKDDFIIIKANWEPKDHNFVKIAEELNILPESLVFIDDNPAERAIVTGQIPGVIAPDMDNVENYIRIIDKSGFFEVTSLSKDDLQRNEMYKVNIERTSLKESYKSYEDYLLSLKMLATIKNFESVYMLRIAQLINKSNQFNLTTRRYTRAEIEQIALDDNYITLYGKLEDKFGANGVVSVIIGEIKEAELHIDLWVMSCRVLKRDMEFAMMDILIKRCIEKGITTIIGYYYPTVKNAMVKDFYSNQGFIKDYEDKYGNTKWKLTIENSYTNKNKTIKVEDL